MHNVSSSFDSGQFDCMKMYRLYNSYIDKTMGLLGFILNTICLVVFTRLLKQPDSNGQMVKCLLLKSAVDAYVMLKIIIFLFFDCSYCDQYKYYATGLFKLVFLIYLSQVAQFLSIFYELCAVIIRFVSVSQIKMLVSKKLTFKLVTFIITMYSLVFYSYKLFENKVTLSVYKNYIKNTSDLVYKLRLTEFGVSDTFLKIEFLHSLIRDGVLVLIIFLLNCFTLISMRRFLKKKKSILGHDNKTDKSAEIHLTLMVVFTGFIAILGHGLYFLFYIPALSWFLSECFYPIVNFSYNLSYLVNFFIYLSFNKMFRKCFLNLFERQHRETNVAAVWFFFSYTLLKCLIQSWDASSKNWSFKHVIKHAKRFIWRLFCMTFS